MVDSRDTSNGEIRRRRECEDCGYRFNTRERIDAIKLQVEKKNGSIEPYSRQKVVQGIELATEKCKVTPAQINSLVDNLEYEFVKADLPVIPTSKIGKGILKRLKNIDEVAYVRFSSVYKSFSSIKSFEKELAKLEKIK